MNKVLYRGSRRPQVFSEAKLLPSETPVQGGLSLSPSDIERLSQQGIAVSTPAADSFFSDNSGDNWTVSPEYMKNSDRNSLWELSKSSRERILSARRRDIEKFGK